jgi:hypothetical protein
LSDETETVTVMTGNTEKSGFNVFLGIFDKHYFFAEK